MTLVPVPEASTMIAGALLLLPFGASTLRILRPELRSVALVNHVVRLFFFC